MIKFVVGLNDEGQSEDAREKVGAFLARHGIKQTTGGMVTLSFQASRDAFDEVFQSTASELPDPLPRGEAAVGASGPDEEPPISVPEELEPFVDYVSIAPTARHFDSGRI